MNHAHIYFFNTDLKIILYTNSPFAHSIAKATETFLPAMHSLFDSNAEGKTCVCTNLHTSTFFMHCNIIYKDMHALFSSELEMRDTIMPSTASLYTVWNVLPIQHSGCKLHLDVSTSVDQWGSPSNMMRWKARCAYGYKYRETISSLQDSNWHIAEQNNKWVQELSVLLQVGFWEALCDA